MLIGSEAANISQCLCISGNQVVYLKYILFLIVNYMSVKLGEEGRKKGVKERN